MNNKVVKTLDEFRSAALKSKESGYLVLKTHDRAIDGLLVALSLEKILSEESNLAARFIYPKSTLHS